MVNLSLMNCKNSLPPDIRPILLESVVLEEYLEGEGYRLPIPLGARLWKRNKGTVIFHQVYGLLGLLKDDDVKPYKIIPPHAAELHFPNSRKLDKFEYIMNQHSNGFFY